MQDYSVMAKPSTIYKLRCYTVDEKCISWWNPAFEKCRVNSNRKDNGITWLSLSSGMVDW